MIASYRLQLQPGFGFGDVAALLPYFRRLGISHLYLSPITEARLGSTHGYDVVDHNQVRDELGGPDAFLNLVKAARASGLGVILDFVPNHAGVGPRNPRWQDVLAYGPHSPYAYHFDIEWDPLKPDLRHKVLLPFLGTTYGDALDDGTIRLAFEFGRLVVAYDSHRFALSPATIGDVLAEIRLRGGDPAPEGADRLAGLEDAFRALRTHERARADELRRRLGETLEHLGLAGAASEIRGARLHAILEEQFWRLAYWRTAAHEINYRRFFDVNDLVALRTERAEVFEDTHRLLARLLALPGVDGVRIDHVDGLFDPQQYLERLRALGARHVWVEKILAEGETLPEEWPVEGTTGYEFLNDVMGVLLTPDGEPLLDRLYRRFVGDPATYGEEVHDSKRAVIETALPGELRRLAVGLDRISEADYHTRDFTLAALRGALAEVAAAFPRYRTYLPYQVAEAEAVVQLAIHTARARNPGTEPTVYTFIGQVLLGEAASLFAAARAEWVGRFQQYTAPLAAKGVEDTAFYRYVRFAALNEVGGQPDRFGVSPHAFHARARFRVMRHPRNLLATATHDHKRGEDTRMRLIVLAEVPDAWRRTVGLLSRIARRHRTVAGPTRADEYLFYQTLTALWAGADRAALPDRLSDYMRKAAREAKRSSSWLNPEPRYENALEQFVRGMVGDPRVARAIEPLAQSLAHYGFINTITQLLLKTTAPGVPDFYQGGELLDLSLVDPDNRRPVDFEGRARILRALEPMLASPEPAQIQRWVAERDERIKPYAAVRVLRFRHARPGAFGGGYRSLEPQGVGRGHALAYARETEDEVVVVIVPRFPATLERLGGWADTAITLPAHLANRSWTDVLTGHPLEVATQLPLGALPLPWAVLFSEARSP